ncbi:hypothetical protein [Limnobaculum zhutongyuii]|nr:hypothetical protein [Limnobaculum zhutongyuii]
MLFDNWLDVVVITGAVLLIALIAFIIFCEWKEERDFMNSPENKNYD